MSTAVFDYKVNTPVDEQINYKTIVTAFDSGKEQRRQKWSRPKRVWSLSFRGRADTDIANIWNFYKARLGRYDPFRWENPNDNPILGEVVGSGDGAITVFTVANFPMVSGSQTVYKAGVPQTITTHYTLDVEVGQITFLSAPASGDRITADYRFYYTVRFQDDTLSRSLIAYKVMNSSLGLVEVV